MKTLFFYRRWKKKSITEGNLENSFSIEDGKRKTSPEVIQKHFFNRRWKKKNITQP